MEFKNLLTAILLAIFIAISSYFSIVLSNRVTSLENRINNYPRPRNLGEATKTSPAYYLVDPVFPEDGEMWYNKTENRLKLFLNNKIEELEIPTYPPSK
jgi:hypothetical protein